MEEKASAIYMLPVTSYLLHAQIIGRPAANRRPATPPSIPVSWFTWWAGVNSGRYPAGKWLALSDVRSEIGLITSPYRQYDPVEPLGII